MAIVVPGSMAFPQWLQIGEQRSATLAQETFDNIQQPTRDDTPNPKQVFIEHVYSPLYSPD